jgi:biopolymer transport protein ExbD
VAIALGGNTISAVINVTPLIDVVMVLLIVFMLLPSRTVGLESELPQPPPDDNRAPPNPQDLVLCIRKDRSIDINSQPVPLEQLEDRLKTLFASRPNGVLFLTGARELDFEDVATVIDKAHGAGVTRIGIMTEKGRP